jgi:hypothetical protein
VAAEPPVVLSAELTSSDPDDTSQLSLAPTGAMNTVLVALRSSENVATVGPDGVSVDATGICGEVVTLAADSDDVPQLFASTLSDSEEEAFDSLWTPAEPTWSADFIAGGTIIPALYGDYFEGNQVLDGVAQDDGSKHALVFSYRPEALSLFQRSGADSWAESQRIGTNTQYAKLTVDSLGRQRVVYAELQASSYYHYSVWTDGETLEDFLADGYYSPSFAVAAGLSGLLGVTSVTRNDLVFTTIDGTSVGDDQILPNSTHLDFNADPCYRSASVCEPLVCEFEGLIDDSVSLAATSDGAFWLAYRYGHLQKEYTVSGTNTHDCFEPNGTTLTSEVILVRLSPDGSTAPSTRFTYPEPTGSRAPLDLVARGDRLYLGVPEPELARVFVLNWAAL